MPRRFATLVILMALAATPAGCRLLPGFGPEARAVQAFEDQLTPLARTGSEGTLLLAFRLFPQRAGPLLLAELQEPRLMVIPEDLDRADELNGLQWQGTVRLAAAATRFRLLLPGTETSWGRWIEGTGPLRFQGGVSSQAGQWRCGLQPRVQAGRLLLETLPAGQVQALPTAQTAFLEQAAGVAATVAQSLGSLAALFEGTNDAQTMAAAAQGAGNLLGLAGAANRDPAAIREGLPITPEAFPAIEGGTAGAPRLPHSVAPDKAPPPEAAP